MTHGSKSGFRLWIAALALAGCGSPEVGSSSPALGLGYNAEVDCRDGLDNDGDGAIDCQDTDCQATKACECRAVGQVKCCYPVCGPDEELRCLGDNICGYPCSCVRKCTVCGPCVSDNDCPYGQTCDAARRCLSSCSCPACDVCAGFCSGDPKAPKYYYTCGDPVCHGYTGGSGLPLCNGQKPGEPCNNVCEACDPKDPCNRLIVCATSDPTQQPGGCPISRRSVKHDIEYLDDGELARVGDELLRTRLARFRYNFEPDRTRLGFVIEDQPGSPAVDPERNMVDLYGYTSMAVAALKRHAGEIATLRAEMDALKARLDGKAKRAVAKR